MNYLFSADECPKIEYSCAQGLEPFSGGTDPLCSCGCRRATGTDEGGEVTDAGQGAALREEACPSPGPACPQQLIAECRNGTWVCIAESGGSANNPVNANSDQPLQYDNGGLNIKAKVDQSP